MLAYILALVLLCLTAVLFTYTNINDGYMDTFVYVIVGITNLIGSILVARKIKEKGIVLGMVFGIMYFLLIYLISGISFGFVINVSAAIYLVTALLTGMLGGILGVNI
jgi:putative membrane protein (TIGR04086 family)